MKKRTRLTSIITYKPILPDCKKCKRGRLDGEGHVYCTAIGEWGDLSECDGWCKFFKEKKHRRKKANR